MNVLKGSLKNKLHSYTLYSSQHEQTCSASSVGSLLIDVYTELNLQKSESTFLMDQALAIKLHMQGVHHRLTLIRKLVK